MVGQVLDVGIRHLGQRHGQHVQLARLDQLQQQVERAGKDLQLQLERLRLDLDRDRFESASRSGCLVGADEGGRQRRIGPVAASRE